jgi:hypothetical protein
MFKRTSETEGIIDSVNQNCQLSLLSDFRFTFRIFRRFGDIMGHIRLHFR